MPEEERRVSSRAPAHVESFLTCLLHQKRPGQLGPFVVPPRQRALVVGALLLIFTLELVHVARVYSATWDEAHHLYDGYTVWTRHDYRLNPEVPPLVKLTAALPLLPLHLYAPPNQGRSEPKEAFLDGRAFVFGNGGDRVLFPARMACMLFSLLLAWLLYAAAREMFGDMPALAALALFVLDPNILAHGALITTDVGSACCIFGAVYAFYRYAKAPGTVRLLITGLATGLAMCAKFTGIFVLPMLLLLAVAEGPARPEFNRPETAPRGMRFCSAVCLGSDLGLLWLP